MFEKFYIKCSGMPYSIRCSIYVSLTRLFKKNSLHYDLSAKIIYGTFNDGTMLPNTIKLICVSEVRWNILIIGYEYVLFIILS